MAKFLIAGGSGMIGSKLIKKLKQNNIDYVFLSTQKNVNSLKNRYHWNPDTNMFPDLDLKSFDAVINFCGAGIFDKEFTEERKRVLLDSRVSPILALKKAFENQNVKVPYFISASATGIYPNICSDVLDENSPHGSDYLSQLVEAWESAIFDSQSWAEKTGALRIGIVLSDTGGFLKPLETSVNWFVGAAPGSGKQMVSWVHVDDLCEMILFAIQHKLEGPFNGTAPKPESMQTLLKQLALQLKRPLILPNIPVFALKLIFGKERHKLLLTDQTILPKRMLDAGFKFKFSSSQNAIQDIYKK